MEEAALHAAPTEALLFVITCILIGIAVKYFLGWLPIPYTAILLVIGLAIGLIQGANPQTHAFTATLSQWMNIDPHLLLLIFLPTIGFSAALGQEPHLLRKNWPQILILAWPGVVITFLLIAFCAKYFFPYGWSWPEALLFGAMLSATDPVAVVAVLHEVGADEKLANVIDGESLVNDGSALVIFLVLQTFVQGGSLTVGQIVVTFIQLAFLGAAVGLAFALVTSVWLSRIFNDPGLEIILTFGAAYSCYFVSEELLNASGLLAVVVMGFSMSIVGGRQMTSRIKVEMTAFWDALEWLANTILFIWVGIALGLVLPPSPTHPALQFGIEFSYHLAATDAAYAVVLYLWLIVSRTVAIGVFYPILSSGHVGYAMNWKTALVMIWAGLRGAVGVAMSLFILVDTQITSEEYKVHALFYMATMAFATVLINGSTAKYLLRALGLLKMTPEQMQVLEHVLSEVESIRESHLEHMEPSAVLGAPNHKIVCAWTSVDTQSLVSKARRRFKRTHAAAESGLRSRGNKGVREAAQAAVEGHGWQLLLAEYRTRLLRVVKATYGDLYQHFELGTSDTGLLQEATDEALDAVHQQHRPKQHRSHRTPPHSNTGQKSGSMQQADLEHGQDGGGGLVDWEQLKQGIEDPGWAGKFDRLFGACLPNKYLRTPMQQQAAALKLVILAAFVKAHTIAQELLQEHLSELHDQHSPTSSGSSKAPAVGATQSHNSHGRDQQSATAFEAGSSGSSSSSDSLHTALSTDKQVPKQVPVSGLKAGGSKANVTNRDGVDKASPGVVDGVGGDVSDDVRALHIVLQESRDEVAAVLEYAQQVVLPDHPRLAALLMSRYVSIKVLEEQLDYLNSIEAAGLIRGEEIKSVQQKLNERLELLQQQSHWHLPPTNSPGKRAWLQWPWTNRATADDHTTPQQAVQEALEATELGASELAVRRNLPVSAPGRVLQGGQGQGLVSEGRRFMSQDFGREQGKERKGFNYTASLRRRYSERR